MKNGASAPKSVLKFVISAPNLPKIPSFIKFYEFLIRNKNHSKTENIVLFMRGFALHNFNISNPLRTDYISCGYVLILMLEIFCTALFALIRHPDRHLRTFAPSTDLSITARVVGRRELQLAHPADWGGAQRPPCF
jgi:hypothetical protein